MGKLILLRHGHTALNRPGDDERLRSWLDIPLDETGMEEAAKIAETLMKYPIRSIYCSDLRRARQTAEMIRRRIKAPITATPELRPWNLGAFGGQRVKEILPFLRLLNQRPDLPAPAGESFYQFYGRYSYRLNALLEIADSSDHYVLAVTHVRNLLAATVIIEGGDRAKVPVKGGPSTGSVSIVEKIEGRWKIFREDGRAVVQSPVVALGKASAPDVSSPSYEWAPVSRVA